MKKFQKEKEQKQLKERENKQLSKQKAFEALFTQQKNANNDDESNNFNKNLQKINYNNNELILE